MVGTKLCFMVVRYENEGVYMYIQCVKGKSVTSSVCFLGRINLN